MKVHVTARRAGQVTETIAELHEARSELSAARPTILEAELSCEMAERNADLSRHECTELHERLADVRRALTASHMEHAEEAGLRCVANDRVADLEHAQCQLEDRCATLSNDITFVRDEVCQQRRFLATTELRASNEQAGRMEATAQVERLRAELEVAESRLNTRGTHVELLLREKERLWGQLSRERRKSEPRVKTIVSTVVVTQPKTPPKKEPTTLENTPPPSTNIQSPARAASTGAKLQHGRCAGKATKALASSIARAVAPPAAVATCSVAELERKLWHTQRALDKERRCHEETRQALRAFEDIETCRAIVDVD